MKLQTDYELARDVLLAVLTGCALALVVGGLLTALVP